MIASRGFFLCLCVLANDVGMSGAIALATMLKKNETLQSLNLSGACFICLDFLTLASSMYLDNNIQDDGAVALAVALEQNATLTTLELTRTWLLFFFCFFFGLL